MRIQVRDIRQGTKVSHPEHGTFIVQRMRFHFRIGLEIFDQDGERVGLLPYSDWVEVQD